MKQGRIKRLRGVQGDIIDAMLSALLFIRVNEMIDFFQIIGPNVPGLCLDFFIGFHVDKECIFPERECALHPVQYMEYNHFMFAMSEMF